jgi:MFS family permease
MTSVDFWKYWIGQLLSNFGSAFVMFATPLLVYRLTGSAVNLSLSVVCTFVPYILFGLTIGTLVDRVGRKKLMITADLARGLMLATIPVLSTAGLLSVWWLYAVGFVNATLTIAFQGAEFAAVKSLVPESMLLTANARIQSSFQAAQVIGPAFGGLMVGAGLSIPAVFSITAVTYLMSAVSLALIRTEFNGKLARARQRLRTEITEGLRFTFRHPVLRNIGMVTALVNFFAVTIWAELVIFARHQYGASPAHIGLLYACQPLGACLLTFLAARTRRYVSFSVATLGALMGYGVLIFVVTFVHNFWAALPIWVVATGLPFSFTIHTVSLRQKIVPDHMLGRVMTVAQTVAWCGFPTGALAGGFAVAETHNVTLVYAAVGVAVFMITSAFWLTALGHPDRYLNPAAGVQPAVRPLASQAITDTR